MRRFGILGAVAVIVAIAASSVCARAATAEVGKPLALLAGLSPPHEAKHKHFRHVAHATSHHVSHAKAAHEKTVGRTRHARMAAAHARHASARKLARREYEHHEKAVTASAFAEEPPVQAAASPTPPSLTPAAVQPKRNEASVGGAGALATEPAVAPVPANAPPNADADLGLAAAEVQTVKIVPPNQNAASDPSAANVVSSATVPTDGALVAQPSQTVLAAPAQEQKSRNADPVGSASWIAQVLAALGGAVTAGTVAWFLIGGGPVRTYG